MRAPGLEVVGIRAEWWAAETQQPVQKVIITARRLAESGEDPYELARYLSSGNDTGATAYSSALGGSTQVRDSVTQSVIATYRDGVRVES